MSSSKYCADITRGLRNTMRLRVSVLAALAATVAVRVFAQTNVPDLNYLPPGDMLAGGSRALLPLGMKLRSVYPKGLSVTKSSEGWVPHLYNDAVKYCSIGYGHLIKKAPCNGSEPEEFRRELTEPQGESLLVKDMANAQYTVMIAVRAPLTNGQFAALADFVFNVGSANFQGSTLLRVVNAKQLEQVPAQFRRWVLASGEPWPGLRKRREREIELYFEGLPSARGLGPGQELPLIDIRTGEKEHR
jgi:GH24 family phage-related lysozyme (muramidase)